MQPDEREVREQDFWGHHLLPVDRCLAEFHAGPEPNTAAMLAAVEPLAGGRVLDFACGTGTTSAWLAARGADVVGIDLSPHAIDRASEVLDALGLEARLIAGALDDADDLGLFDAVVGRYALHHVDVPALAPVLARKVRPGGRAAFVETFASNPLLRWSRSQVLGRLGVPRMGTVDERPLGRGDMEALRAAFGSARITVAELRFLRIFDRQVLRYRSARASSVLGALDDLIGRLPGTSFLSYHQVVVLHKAGLNRDGDRAG